MKAVFFIAIGSLLLIVAIFLAFRTNGFVSQSLVAPGRVVELNSGGSHPQIEFTTAAGEAVSYPQGGMIWGYKVGDAVTVRYRAEEPRLSASLDTFGALWFWPLIAAFIGGVFIIGGIVNLPGRS